MTPATASDFWRGKTALVTGVMGFLGPHLCLALLERGARVWGVFRDVPQMSNFGLLGLEDRVELVQADCANLSAMQHALDESRAEVVFHLAAQAIVGTAKRFPFETLETNVRGTYSVLEAARHAHEEGRGPLRGLVVASSYNAYGAQEALPYQEGFALLGRHPYDASKACADTLAQGYAETYRLPVAVTRCSNLYGHGDFNLTRLIPSTTCAVLRGQRPVIHSDGSPVRDYLHVEDAVAGYLAIAEQLDRPQVRGEAFNLGTECPVSVLELCREIIGAVGREDIVPDVKGDANGGLDRQYLSSGKAARVLGWRAAVPRAEGLARTVAWYREQIQAGNV